MKHAVIGLVLLLFTTASAVGQSLSRHYFNQNYNFCIDYPSQWQEQVPFDGNAIELTPPEQKLRYPYPKITVGGRVNQPSEQNDTRGETLEEVFDSDLAAIQGWEKARAVKVVEKHWSKLVGYTAIVSDIEYTIDDQRLHEHQILILTASEAVFEITSTCHPGQMQQFTPVFQGIVRSFRIRCNPRLPERP
jgi:hypothetical protein